MTNEELKIKIIEIIPEAEFNEENQFLEATIPSSKIKSLAVELKNNSDLSFDFLFCLTGVDWVDHMMVVYHFKSTTFNHQIAVKAKIENRENSEIDTVCDIWRTAEFHEREAYDLFGIIFKDHPDLRRLFLDDDWVGWPMRKDYEDSVNMIDYQ